MHIITIIGDSMEKPDGGGLRPGDKVLVDTGQKLPSPPGIFATWDGLAVVVKRLEYLDDHDPPMIRLISDNPAHRTYERHVEEVNIVGRVIGLWRRV